MRAIPDLPGATWKTAAFRRIHRATGESPQRPGLFFRRMKKLAEVRPRRARRRPGRRHGRLAGLVRRPTRPLPRPRPWRPCSPTTGSSVEDGEFIVFRPAGALPTTGVILYPGAGCDVRGYAPVLRRLADRGYLVVAVPMPLNMAIFGINRADDVRAAFPDVQRWVIAGHSMGGAMAARYAHKHPDDLAGLILWDSRPAGERHPGGPAVSRVAHPPGHGRRPRRRRSSSGTATCFRPPAPGCRCRAASTCSSVPSSAAATRKSGRATISPRPSRTWRSPAR